MALLLIASFVWAFSFGLIKKYLGWAPGIRLRDGMEKTYHWINEEYLKARRGGAVSC